MAGVFEWHNMVFVQGNNSKPLFNGFNGTRGQRGGPLSALKGVLNTRSTALVYVDLEAGCCAVLKELLPLSEQVGDCACKTEKIISIGKDTDLMGKASCSRQAAKVIASVAQLQPAEKWFKKDQKKERREGVSLDSATTNCNRLGRSKGGADGGSSMVVDSSDVLDTKWGKTQVCHDLVEPMMWETVKGRGEVNPQGIDILVK